jgi:RimJ/RimL family protein N-acetyltransferase
MTVVLKPARMTDAGLVLAWRNDPAEWARSGTGRPVWPDEHLRWWHTHAMDATRCRLWLLRVDDWLVGMIRFDRLDRAAVVSLYVAPAYRGQGIGRQAFEAAWAHRPVWAETAVADVRRDNPDSEAFFRALGFDTVSETPAMIRLGRPAHAA